MYNKALQTLQTQSRIFFSKFDLLLFIPFLGNGTTICQTSRRHPGISFPPPTRSNTLEVFWLYFQNVSWICSSLHLYHTVRVPVTIISWLDCPLNLLTGFPIFTLATLLPVFRKQLVWFSYGVNQIIWYPYIKPHNGHFFGVSFYSLRLLIFWFYLAIFQFFKNFIYVLYLYCLSC